MKKITKKVRWIAISKTKFKPLYRVRNIPLPQVKINENLSSIRYPFSKESRLRRNPLEQHRATNMFQTTGNMQQRWKSMPLQQKRNTQAKQL